MQWSESFPQANQPTWEEIRGFIATGLWDELTQYLETSYKVKPLISYSGCSAQPGWNVKYKKGGRSLCTLYPMADYFIALVVIGNKEQPGLEYLLPTLSTYTRELCQNTPFSAGGRWLMIEVRENAVLRDVRTLVGLRATGKN